MGGVSLLTRDVLPSSNDSTIDPIPRILITMIAPRTRLRCYRNSYFVSESLASFGLGYLLRWMLEKAPNVSVRRFFSNDSCSNASNKGPDMLLPHTSSTTWLVSSQIHSECYSPAKIRPNAFFIRLASDTVSDHCLAGHTDLLSKIWEHIGMAKHLLFKVLIYLGTV